MKPASTAETDSSSEVLTLAGGNVVLALIPLVVGLLSAFVAYGRWS